MGKALKVYMAVWGMFLALLALLLLQGCATPNGPAVAIDPIRIQVEVEGGQLAGDEAMDVPDNDVKRMMGVRNPETELSDGSSILNGVGLMQIVSTINSYDLSKMWRDLMYFQAQNINEVTIFVHSGGGSAFAGFATADLILKARDEGMTITAYASGIIASATVPIIAVCSHRVAAPGTIFMVHEPELFKYFTSEKASDIRAQNEMMVLLEGIYTGYLERNTKLHADEWSRMSGRTTWFSVDEALKWGLIDEIK